MKTLTRTFWVVLFWNVSSSAAVFTGAGQLKVFVDSANGNLMGATNSVLEDLDGDGDIDAFMVFNDTYITWLNDVTGGRSTTHFVAKGFSGRSVALGDMNGDGKTDAFLGSDGADRVLWGDGRGGFTDSGQRLGDFDTRCVGVIDADSDGDLDLWLGKRGGNSVLVNDGKGRFHDSGLVFGESGRSDEIAIGDVNSDGLRDIVVADRSGIQVWLDQPGLDFHLRMLPGRIGGDRVFLVDLDQDCDLDMWVGRRSRGPGDDRVFLNDGQGRFQSDGRAKDSMALSFGDYDGDGDSDALLGGRGAFRVLENDGSGAFVDSGQRIANGEADSAVTLDLDGDGDLDVWLTYPYLNRILVNGEVPRIESITVMDEMISIEFFGTLVSSDGLSSDFDVVERATSPFSIPISGEIKFFGVR